MGIIWLDREGINSLWNFFVVRWKVKVSLKKIHNWAMVPVCLLESCMLSSGSKCFFRRIHLFTNRNKKWRMSWLAWGKLQGLFKVRIYCWGAKLLNGIWIDLLAGTASMSWSSLTHWEWSWQTEKHERASLSLKQHGVFGKLNPVLLKYKVCLCWVYGRQGLVGKVGRSYIISDFCSPRECMWTDVISGGLNGSDLSFERSHGQWYTAYIGWLQVKTISGV